MRGFAARATVEQAAEWLDGQLAAFFDLRREANTAVSIPAGRLPRERLPATRANGRVLSTDVISRIDVPQFSRAMMDGFAVQASDTQGASSYNRLPLQVVGQVLPGAQATTEVGSGTAVRIMTGAPLPPGADAVLPVEKVDLAGEVIHVTDPIPPGKHVGLPGEDIRKNQQVLSAGRRLRPQDIGVLASIGVAEVEVVRSPRVRIVVTGNELLPPGSTPAGSRIVDSNSPMLSALIERDGGTVLHPGIVPDDPEAILAALQDDAEIVVVSGGSSVGQEDHAPTLLAEHGLLAIHGIAMRPSSPAGMGRLEERLIFLLPGNPVSCLCAYDFFAGRAIRILSGRSPDWPYPIRVLPLERKLVSVVGRVDYARVRIEDGRVVPLAISGASVLSSTTRADGFVVIPADSEGFPANADVHVFLYD